MKLVYLMCLIIALFNFNSFSVAAQNPAPAAGPDPIVYNICTSCNMKWAQSKGLKNGPVDNQTSSVPSAQGKAAQGAGNSVDR